MRFCNDGNHLVQINLLNFSDVPRRSRLFYVGNDIFMANINLDVKNAMAGITLSYGGYSTTTDCY